MTQNIFSENRGESIKEHTTEIDNFILQYVLYANLLSSEQRYAYSIFASCTCHEESESAYAYDITSLRETADHIFENLIAEILKFFMTGKSVIPQEQTVGIAALLEKSIAMLHGI